jgi:hypothetical protein
MPPTKVVLTPQAVVELVDEEKINDVPAPTRKSRYLNELYHPTWRLWTLLGLAMFIPALIITTTLLALANKSHAHPQPGPSATPNKATVLGPVVDLGYSQYQGLAAGDINQWLGMRFAQPPLGDLRFRAPQAPASTSTLQPAQEV